MRSFVDAVAASRREEQMALSPRDIKEKGVHKNKAPPLPAEPKTGRRLAPYHHKTSRTRFLELADAGLGSGRPHVRRRDL